MKNIFILFSFILLALNACGGGNSLQNPLGDFDLDGVINQDDCDPENANVKPGAIDLPDENLIDANCDGVDGEASKGVWVSASEGNDAAAGTITEPVKTISKAIQLAAAKPDGEKYVQVVVGTYSEDILLNSNVSLYGGYGLLGAGVRTRNLGSQRATLLGVDGDKKINETFNGSVSNMDYSILVFNTTSTVEGLIIYSDMNGFGIIVINADATIDQSVLNEKSPVGFRSVSGLIAVIVDPVATKNYTVHVTKNSLEMLGNGAVGNGTNIGVAALPADNSVKNIELNITNNTVLSKGEGEKAVAFIAADSDDDPTDDATLDAHADISLNVENNKITMMSNHKIAAGVAAGVLVETTVLPNPNFYIAAFKVLANSIVYNGTGFGVGVSVGLVREPSLIANNSISLATTGSMVLGIISLMGEVDIYYNTVVANVLGKSIYGLLFMGTDNVPMFSKYKNETPGSVINNIFSLKSVSAVGCGVVGVGELVNVAADADVNIGSPQEFKNNDLFIQTDCATTILYGDQQTASPPDTKLNVPNINNLNNKVGFRPDDPTVFANNIAVDPQFTSVASGDFTLLDGSPCLNSGMLFETNWTDINGVLRPQGTSVDMGAFEK